MYIYIYIYIYKYRWVELADVEDVTSSHRQKIMLALIPCGGNADTATVRHMHNSRPFSGRVVYHEFAVAAFEDGAADGGTADMWNVICGYSLRVTSAAFFWAYCPGLS